MRQWHYSQQKEQRGPVSEPQLIGLLESGELSSDTLVWCEGMVDWVPAHEVEGLLPFSSTANSTDELDVIGPRATGSLYEPTGEQARPWVRYWARLFDIAIFSLGMGLLLAIIYEPALDMNDNLFGLIILFVYVFVEPVILSIWGTTPGKALFRIRLRTEDDSKLSYSEALGRSFSVWFRGIGLGLPIVTLITHVIAYNKLVNEEITSWDENGNFTVSHQTVGPWRVIIALLVFAGITALGVYGQMEA
ncbi:MAG: RDD family protein [Verrucomicrobia bacterium]|nr:RDD family protein [Verrucomicrobiota bacterium]